MARKVKASPKKDATYAAARAKAQAAANVTGIDHRLEWLGDLSGWAVSMLPEKYARYGFEASCEVVSCEDLSRCQPGHGPLANSKAKKG